MTTKTSRSLIAAAELERISADLLVAEADVALLERLESATDRVARLTAERDKAAKERDKALAAEAKAAEASRYAHISDVQVTESAESVREHVVRSSWTIHYTTPTWDGRTTAPAQHSANGFSVLSPDVLGYLMDKRPDLIPAKIMALAPDSPTDAFRRYFASLRRGHVAA